MNTLTREQIIQHYLNAYNRFDVAAMLEHLDENIRFENVANGTVNLVLNGRAAFQKQAEEAAALFSERKQTVTAWRHTGDETEADIDYEGVLAADLPNGLKKGERLRLQGRSVFRFRGQEIVQLTDVSP